MANLLNLLRKKRFDQYNQAMQSSPFLPDYYGNPGAHWGEQDSRRAQLLLANPDDLSLDAQVAKVHGPSAQFSEAYYRQGPKHNSNLVGEQGVYDLNNPHLSTMYTDAPLTGTDTIYKDKKESISDKLKNKEAWEALSELQFGKETFKSLGKAGGAGGGKFQVAANPFMSHAMMAPSGGASPEEKKRRERYWAMQGLLS